MAVGHIRKLSNMRPPAIALLEEKGYDSVIGLMTWQLLAQTHMLGCRFLMVTADIQHPLVYSVIRFSALASRPALLLDVRQNHKANELEDLFRGDGKTSCRIVFVDLTSEADDVTVVRFLEKQKLHHWPEAWVILVGGLQRARTASDYNVFRNTLYLFYLGFPQSTLLNDDNSSINNQKMKLKQNPQNRNENNLSENAMSATVFRRCLYCDDGKRKLQFFFVWPIGKDIPQPILPLLDQLHNMAGYTLRSVSMSLFPYNDFQRNSDEPGSIITFRDSLDKRMVETFSSRMNFTSEPRVPIDMKWGDPSDSGNWTGLVGAIQRDEADFITTVAPTPGRIKVIDTIRMSSTDVLAIISLKPHLLPQYLVIIKPFSVDLWIYIVVSTMVWGLLLWFFQRIWSSSSGKPSMTLGRSIFYSWAVMLEDPPTTIPKSISGQIQLGFWLLACLVISTGFRSSLVAYLTVQSKTKPIDSFHDLVSRGDFRWGIEKKELAGITVAYFKVTRDPILQKVYREFETAPNLDELFQRTLEDKYAFICWKRLCQTLIDSYYTDAKGETPYYVSKESLSVVPYFGWAFGKGAPFRDRLNMLMNRMTDSGITDYWLEDATSLRVKRNREEIGEGKEKDTGHLFEDEKTVELRVVHLVGIFLVLFLGYVVATITFLGEISSKFFG